MDPLLRVSFTNDPNPGNASQQERGASLFFRKEGSKASYVLESPQTGEGGIASGAPLASVSGKPVYAVIDCIAGSAIVPFRYGGMNIISNARNIEIYTTDEGGKEKYVFTSRGIKHTEPNQNGPTFAPTPEWHKFVIVNPGGAATVTMVTLKLLSIKPDGCDVGMVQSMTLKCKLPQVEVGNGTKEDLVDGTLKGIGLRKEQDGSCKGSDYTDAKDPSCTGGPTGIGPASEADLGAALAAVTFMVRSTEDRITKNVMEGFRSLEAVTLDRLGQLERHVMILSSALANQSLLSRAIDSQKQIIEQQNSYLDKLLIRQNDILVSIGRQSKTLTTKTSEATCASPPIPDTLGHEHDNVSNDSDECLADTTGNTTMEKLRQVSGTCHKAEGRKEANTLSFGGSQRLPNEVEDEPRDLVAVLSDDSIENPNPNPVVNDPIESEVGQSVSDGLCSDRETRSISCRIDITGSDISKAADTKGGTKGSPLLHENKDIAANGGAMANGAGDEQEILQGDCSKSDGDKEQGNEGSDLIFFGDINKSKMVGGSEGVPSLAHDESYAKEGFCGGKSTEARGQRDQLAAHQVRDFLSPGTEYTESDGLQSKRSTEDVSSISCHEVVASE